MVGFRSILASRNHVLPASNATARLLTTCLLGAVWLALSSCGSPKERDDNQLLAKSIKEIVVTQGGLVFGSNGKEVAAYDAQLRPLWRFVNPNEGDLNALHLMASDSLLLFHQHETIPAGDVDIVASHRLWLRALDQASGDLVWEYDCGINPMTRSRDSLLLPDGKVLLNHASILDTSPRVQAIDEQGQPDWEYSFERADIDEIQTALSTSGEIIVLGISGGDEPSLLRILDLDGVEVGGRNLDDSLEAEVIYEPGDLCVLGNDEFGGYVGIGTDMLVRWWLENQPLTGSPLGTSPVTLGTWFSGGNAANDPYLQLWDGSQFTATIPISGLSHTFDCAALTSDGGLVAATRENRGTTHGGFTNSAVYQFNSAGQPVWSFELEPALVRWLSTDQQGNCYAAFEVLDPGSDDNPLEDTSPGWLIKLDSAGQELARVRVSE